MRSLVALTAVTMLLAANGAALAQALPPNVNCETIADQQRRTACFQQAGIPVINCDRPRDTDEIAFCHSITKTRGERPQPPSVQGTKVSPQETKVSPQEAAAVMQKLSALWKLPAELRDHLDTLDQYVVTVEVSLNRAGMLTAVPTASTRNGDPLFNAVRDSAIRAAIEAQPYNMLPQSAYQDWKEMKIVFDPRSAPSRSSMTVLPKPGQVVEVENSAPQAVLSQRLEPGEEYHRISFEDFLLDGKKLAIDETKISMNGFYYKEGEIELLFPSLAALLIARNTLKMDAAVPLITDDASRDFRKTLLYCRSMPLGCAVNIVGRATMCERANLLGTNSLPCLTADGGRSLERR